MTELLEAIAVVLGNQLEHDSSCSFCKEAEPSPTKSNTLANSASTLRGSLVGEKDLEPNTPGSAYSWQITCTDPSNPNKKTSSNVRANPHHLIPGDASLKGHAIIEVISAEKGAIRSDIVYDVNGHKNGIWLPTIPEAFYDGKKAPPELMPWGKMTKAYPAEQYSHAELAMLVADRQFHDAHPDYSDYMSERLDELNLFIMNQALNCPEVGKDQDKAPPPYGLVALLNGLSQRMKATLLGDPISWKSPKYTSRHAEILSDKKKQGK